MDKIEKKRQEWLSRLNNNTAPPKYPELDAKIHQHIKEKGSIELVDGVFGDTMGCGGYVEGITQQGTKFYGCNYIWKGRIDNQITDRVAAQKRVLMATIRLINKHKWLAILLLFKKSLIDWFVDIYEADLIKHQLKEDEFCPAIRELIRVGRKFIDNEKFVYCIAMILQFDNAYRLRFQDAFSTDNPIKTLLEREKDIAIKYKMLKWMLPFLKINKFIKKMDKDKIKLDKTDWYFCLRRQGYNFGGLSYEERLKIAKQLDKERGNIILGI